MGKVERFTQAREAAKNYQKKTKSKTTPAPQYQSLKEMLTITKLDRPSSPKPNKKSKK